MINPLFIDQLVKDSSYVSKKIGEIKEICTAVVTVVGKREPKVAVLIGAELILGFLDPDSDCLPSYEKHVNDAFEKLIQKEKKKKKLIDAQALIFALVTLIVDLTVVQGEQEDEEKYTEN